VRHALAPLTPPRPRGDPLSFGGVEQHFKPSFAVPTLLSAAPHPLDPPGRALRPNPGAGPVGRFRNGPRTPRPPAQRRSGMRHGRAARGAAAPALLAALLCLAAPGARPRPAAAASLSAVQSAAQLWEQTALNAAEATLKAIQKKTGRGDALSLRGVPPESLKARRARAAAGAAGAAAAARGAPAWVSPPAHSGPGVLRAPAAPIPPAPTPPLPRPQVFVGRQHQIAVELDGIEYKVS
jgi:hypothetical protein